MSEFGDGYTYCLGLFLAHEFRMFEWRNKSKDEPYYLDASMWFNGAADHLYGLQVPEVLPEAKRKEIEEWQNKCLRFRLCMNGEECTWEDAAAACDYAKALLMEWDLLHNIKAEKGDWQ